VGRPAAPAKFWSCGFVGLLGRPCDIGRIIAVLDMRGLHCSIMVVGARWIKHGFLLCFGRSFILDDLARDLDRSVFALVLICLWAIPRVPPIPPFLFDFVYSVLFETAPKQFHDFAVCFSTCTLFCAMVASMMC